MGSIFLPTIDCAKAAKEIEDFIIDNMMYLSDFTGAVIGLSGGVDSTLTAALTQNAFLRSNEENGTNYELKGFYLPSSISQMSSLNDAMFVAETIGIPLDVVNIQNVVEAYKDSNPETFTSKFHIGNLMAEVRATILHQKAAVQKKIVMGTGNHDEDFGVGYYTLFGDGAVHLSPIGNLSKRLVVRMAYYLGFERIAKKTPTAEIEPSQTDFLDLGYEYATVEMAIRGANQDLPYEEIFNHPFFVNHCVNDMNKYVRLTGKEKFKDPKEIFMDILRRNEIALAKSDIVHPPCAEVTFGWEELKCE